MTALEFIEQKRAENKLRAREDWMAIRLHGRRAVNLPRFARKHPLIATGAAVAAGGIAGRAMGRADTSRLTRPLRPLWLVLRAAVIRNLLITIED